MKNIKPKIKIAVILIIVAVASIIYFMYSSGQKKNTTSSGPIAISRSTPANNSAGASVFDPVTITFNQPVNPDTINIVSDPAENWTISQTGQNTIQVNHKQYLRVSTNYTLNVLQHGANVGSLLFETAHEQNDPRELQAIQEDQNKNYPLLSSTPYDTPDYEVVYIAPMTLEIDIKKTSSISSQDAILQVKSWVQSNGIDPTTHKYNVVTTSPAPLPSPAP